MARTTQRKRKRRARELSAKSASSSESEGGSDDDHEEEEERRWQTRRAAKDYKGKGKEQVKEEDEESGSGSDEEDEEQKDAPEDGGEICGICLSEGGNERGKLDCCDHFFCFNCIMEWAKVESRCPMCKQRFVTVIRPAASGVARSRNRTFRIPTRDQVYEPSEEEIRLFTDPYQNTVCTECQEAGDEGLLLLCDRCDAAAHTYCVGLGRSVPRGDWFCQACQSLNQGSSEDEEEDINFDAVDGEEGDGTVSGSILALLVADAQDNPPARNRRLAASTRGPRPLRRSTRRRVARSSHSNSPRLSENLMNMSTQPRRGFFPTLMESYGVARTLFRQRQVQATVHTRLQNMRENWNRFRSGEAQFSSFGPNLMNSNVVRPGSESASFPSSSSTARLGNGIRFPSMEVVGGGGRSPSQPRSGARSAEQTEVERAWAMMDQARRLDQARRSDGRSAGGSQPGTTSRVGQSAEGGCREVSATRTRERQAHGDGIPGVTGSTGGPEAFHNTRSTSSSRDSDNKEVLAHFKTTREENPRESSRRETSTSRGNVYHRDNNQPATNSKDNTEAGSSVRIYNLRESRTDPEVLQIRSILDDKDNSRGSSGRSTKRRDTKETTALQVLSILDDKDSSRGSGPSSRREAERHRCPERDEEMKHMKEQCLNLVQVALKPFFDRGKIDRKQYKEVARLATHTILASVGGSELKHGTDVSLGTVTCDHERLTSSSLIPGCCEPCVQRHVRKFVKNVVKEKVHLYT